MRAKTVGAGRRAEEEAAASPEVCRGCRERCLGVGSLYKAWMGSFCIDFIITKTKFGVSRSYDYTPCSFHPLLSSFLNNFLRSEDNLTRNCAAEASLHARSLVELWDAEHPQLGPAPRGLPMHPMCNGQGREEDNSDRYLTLGGTKEFPFAPRNAETHGQY